MSAEPQPGEETQLLELARRVDRVCTAFEAAWKAGQRPRLEDFLPAEPTAERAAVLRELLPLEADRRRRAGEQPQAEEYQRRFPDLDPAWLAAALAPPPMDTYRAAAPAAGDTTPRAGAAAAGAETVKDGPAVGRVTVPGYEILGELGRGGMGVVYRARQIRLNRQVALKMILAGAHAGPEELARFITEAEAAARLQHPNIVQIYEVGEHDGLPYFSLEFCAGGSLAAKLNGKPLPPAQAAQRVEALARAMHAAHQAGIIHRDLKPANVLLAFSGAGGAERPLSEAVPKITDFGLAKRLDVAAAGRTQSGAILGTPSYMAPEQAAGRTREIGPQTDVYALGAILYECLTGRPPFRGATPLDTMLQVIADDPRLPSRLNAAVPRDLEAICLKALAKEPRRRYAAAADLAADLGRFLAGEPVRARRPGAGERARRWLWRRRQPLLLAGGVAAAVLATLAVVWWNGSFQPPSPEPSPPAQQPPEVSVGDQEKIRVSSANLRKIGLAMASSESAHGHLPQPAIYGKDGTPLLSWRVAILPYLGEKTLYSRFKLDEPWDSEHNRALLPYMPKAYEIPGTTPPGEYRTFYQVIVGPGAMFEPDPKRFIRRIGDVTDDLGSTLLLVEAGEPVEWTRPADLAFGPDRPLPRLGGVVAAGFQACFCDSATRFLDKDIYKDEKTLRALIGRQDGELVNLRPYERDPNRIAPPTAPATPRETPKEQPKDVKDLAAAYRETGRKLRSRGNLQQLGRALRAYHDARGSLPPPAIYDKDGTPLLSWRVAVLPYLGQKTLYSRFKLDEAWDGPNNRDLLPYMPKVFEAPDVTTKDANQTFYQLFVGPGAYEPGPKRRTLPASIPDGSSNTIAVAEAAEPVPWTKPADLPFAPDQPLPRLGGVLADGFNAALFDGSTLFFKKAIYGDEAALRALIGWSDGEVVNLRPYLEPQVPEESKDELAPGAKDAARRAYSQNSLKQLGIAMHNYHSTYGRLPPFAIADKDGRPLLSWRVALLPFLEQGPLYRKFKLDEPWDGPNNKKLLPLMPRLFEIPGVKTDDPDATFYQVFVGPGAAFEPDLRKKVRFADITDGTANTLLIVDAAEAVPWTKPQDLFFQADKPLPRLGGHFADGFNGCMADGSIRFFSGKLTGDERSLRALIGIRDGQKVDPDAFR
jgi:hypothetical protein